MICHETSTCTGSLIFGIQESYKSHCDKLPFEDVLYVPLRFRIKGFVCFPSESHTHTEVDYCGFDSSWGLESRPSYT